MRQKVVRGWEPRRELRRELGRESRTMAQRSRPVVEMVSKCQEIRRSVGIDGPVRDDRDLWKGDRAPPFPTAMGVMEAS